MNIPFTVSCASILSFSILSTQEKPELNKATEPAGKTSVQVTDPALNEMRERVAAIQNLNTTKVHQGNAADAASSSDFYTQNFDALGRVSIKVDQIGTTCTMNYDLAGRMTEKQYHTGATPAQGGTITPGGTLESTDTFSYDAASRLTATTKGRHNISTEHTYAADSMPLTEKLVADGRSYESTRSYDAANRPLSHIYPNGKSTYWAYTEQNLVASIHYEDKLVADQSHDAGYRLTSQTLGNGLVRTISYGRQDNLRTADSVAGKQDLQMTYSYAADKQITAETIAEDVLADTSFTASYDAGNRITNWNRAVAPVNNAQSWNYDDNGNWISTTKDGATEARNHDNTDQLTQIAGKASTNDAKGNLTAYEQNGKEYEIDYDLDNCPRSAHALRNRISSSGNAGRDLSIKTDAVIIKVDIDNNDVEKYRRLVGILDLESKANVARRVSSREADANQYRYDALGPRVIRQEGTTKTALIWWGNSEKHRRLVGVLDRMSGASEARRVKAREASLNQCAEHKHQAGQIHFIPFSLRQVVGSPPSLQIMKRQSRYSVVIQNDIMAHPSRLNSVIARAVDGSKFKLEWYHKNYLDHVYAVSDDSGDILEHYRYTAFGEVQIYNASGNQVATTQIDNHILWNTRRRDEVTGYYLYKYRHYSAELGRWLARDPIEEKGGVNLYGFVGNEPVGKWDYLGLAVTTFDQPEIVGTDGRTPGVETVATISLEVFNDPDCSDEGGANGEDSCCGEVDFELRFKWTSWFNDPMGNQAAQQLRPNTGFDNGAGGATGITHHGAGPDGWGPGTQFTSEVDLGIIKCVGGKETWIKDFLLDGRPIYRITVEVEVESCANIISEKVSIISMRAAVPAPRAPTPPPVLPAPNP